MRCGFEIAAFEETVCLARRFVEVLELPLRCYLKGEIGSGKTTWVREVCRALGVIQPVKSPTFSLVECYQANGVRIMHADLYRLQNAEELWQLGLDELIADSDLCFIEWPLRHRALPLPDLLCWLRYSEGDHQRRCRFAACSQQGQDLLAKLNQGPVTQ